MNRHLYAMENRSLNRIFVQRIIVFEITHK